MITFWPSKMITFMLSFILSFMLSFGVIIYFMLSFNVIIFDVNIWYYHLVLSFGVIIYLMLSFDVIISHSLQMLSFLCYHFSLYSIGVIIFVIILCYHFLLSFPPFFLFPENVTHSVPLAFSTQCKHILSKAIESLALAVCNWISFQQCTLIKKKIKFSSYIWKFRMEQLLVIYDSRPPNIWEIFCAFPNIQY